MNKYSVFYDMSHEKINLILNNLSGEERILKKREFILKPNECMFESAIIKEGLAYLISVSDSGEKNIIDFYSEENILGKSFLPDNNVNLYYIIAKKECRIIFFEHKKIFSVCQNYPNINKKFLDNIINSIVHREQIHIDILSQRTIRKKLLISFKYFSEISGKNDFTLPMPLFDFADYICVDRSAMMRELKKLNNENIIVSKGKNIILK